MRMRALSGRPWLYYARRLIRAFDICPAIRYLFASTSQYIYYFWWQLCVFWQENWLARNGPVFWIMGKPTAEVLRTRNRDRCFTQHSSCCKNFTLHLTWKWRNSHKITAFCILINFHDGSKTTRLFFMKIHNSTVHFIYYTFSHLGQPGLISLSTWGTQNTRVIQCSAIKSTYSHGT